MNVVRPQGPPMMKITIEKDAEGKLKIEGWIKEVSPAGIILGNQRPAAPVEICHLCATVEVNILGMALPGAAQMVKQQQQQQDAERGPDDKGQTKAN